MKKYTGHLSALLATTLIASCSTLNPGSGDSLAEAGRPVTGAADNQQQNRDDLKIHADAVRMMHTRLDGSSYEYAHIPVLLPDDLWLQMRKQFTLTNDYQKDPRITAQYNWYRGHPAYMGRVADRGQRYLYFVMEELKKRNMPGELALLPVVESAYDPFAYSHGRASGMWQFIPGTGKMYGLRQDWWYDGRRDIVASTEAALNYLQNLAARFDGDWLLALAAYNSGGGTVSRAIKRNKAQGLPTDFWSLKLPKETSAYVPKLLALSRIVWNSEAAGITLPELPYQPYFTVVNVGSQIDLSEAARLADMDMDDLYLLNPGFNQWATSPEGPHRLLIPVEKATAFQSNLAGIPGSKRVTWQRYTIRSGDTLSTIAKKHSITTNVLKRVNKLNNTEIFAGQTLMIPSAIADSDSYSMSAANRLTQKQNRNPDQKSKTKLMHTVQKGDTFWGISRKYKVSHTSLAKWNGMAPGDPLRPGQELAVWVEKNNQMLAMAGTGRNGVIRKVGYTVKHGDSLYSIARRYNVSVSSLKQWNSFKGKYLQPGDRLTVYVDVTAH